MSPKETWLLLMHQLPPKPDSFRVKIWRALQRIGALQLKNSVYVLPAQKNNEAKFISVLDEINAGGGDAFLCYSEFLQGIDQSEIRSMFQADRSKKYEAVAKELRLLQKILATKARPSENELMAVAHSLGKLERQAREIAESDFFASPLKGPTFKLLEGIQAKVSKIHGGASHDKVERVSSKDFQGKIWATRSQLGVDRMASAWLISRFIDKKAKFKFVRENEYRPKKNEVRFDMFEAEFGHVGDKCTFEVLKEAFSLQPKPLSAIAEIIHDLDLEDTKFNRAETSGIGLILSGISEERIDDRQRIEKANALFDNLFNSLSDSQ
ncbi:MAG: chromate resistance protein [Bdellovibrionaceae bacterium]|nr:chromate resistance protein [Pseudobdellovibrionaceae bacterium]